MFLSAKFIYDTLRPQDEGDAQIGCGGDEMLYNSTIYHNYIFSILSRKQRMIRNVVRSFIFLCSLNYLEMTILCLRVL